MSLFCTVTTTSLVSSSDRLATNANVLGHVTTSVTQPCQSRRQAENAVAPNATTMQLLCQVPSNGLVGINWAMKRHEAWQRGRRDGCLRACGQS